MVDEMIPTPDDSMPFCMKLDSQYRAPNDYSAVTYVI